MLPFGKRTFGLLVFWSTHYTLKALRRSQLSKSEAFTRTFESRYELLLAQWGQIWYYNIRYTKKNLVFSFKFAKIHKCTVEHKHTAKNILGIAHPKHYILLLVSRILEGKLGYFALLVASNQIYFFWEMIFSI